MKISILVFGAAKEIMGTAQKELNLNENATVFDLRTLMEQEFPKLKKLKKYMIAIDDEYAEDEQIILEGNEIAIIPPVSGG